jgi:RNA polymerase sigma factor (sigma-70 family)
MKRQTESNPRPLDPPARALVEEHTHLVGALAREQYHCCKRSVPLEELLGEARLALARAGSLFDACRGVPFGAYATRVIRHRLVQAVTEWRRGGRLDHSNFSEMRQATPGGGLGPFDPVCPRTREPGQLALEWDLLDRVSRSMPRRWFSVLRLYFAEERTMEEIGKQLGVTRSRVQQLVAQALRRARRCA